MSEQNVELHRRALEAFNTRDVEAFIVFCDPEIEFHSTFASVGGARYLGHDGLRQWHRDLHDAWGDGIRVELDEYFDLGDRTLTFGVLYGRGRQSGAEVAMPYAGAVKWRDGLALEWRAYSEKEDALRHLGVSEAELENVEAFKRFMEGFNRRDLDAMLAEVDAGVEWRPAMPVALGGEATVYRGHAGILDGMHDLHGSFAELHLEFSEFQQVGDRVVGIGRIRTRGKESGVESWSPFGGVMEFKDGKATQIRSYLDPREALEALSSVP